MPTNGKRVHGAMDELYGLVAGISCIPHFHPQLTSISGHQILLLYEDLYLVRPIHFAGLVLQRSMHKTDNYQGRSSVVGRRSKRSTVKDL
jgi:hypothetical protein